MLSRLLPLIRKKKETVFHASLSQDTLTEGKLNTASLTWKFMISWATNELVTARCSNDKITKTEMETAALRGRIKLLKEILNLRNEM